MVTERIVRGIVLEFSNVRCLHITVIDAGHKSECVFGVTADPEFVGCALIGGFIGILLCGVKAIIGRIRFIPRINVTATQVIGNVSATVVVVGVVNKRINLAVDVTTGIDQVKVRDSSLERPCGDIELIDVMFRDKLLCAFIP